jgi:hypothetical protein
MNANEARKITDKSLDIEKNTKRLAEIYIEIRKAAKDGHYRVDCYASDSIQRILRNEGYHIRPCRNLTGLIHISWNVFKE